MDIMRQNADAHHHLNGTFNALCACTQELIVQFQQPWGPAMVELSGSHYLDNLRQTNLSGYVNLDVRLLRGLSRRERPVRRLRPPGLAGIMTAAAIGPTSRRAMRPMRRCCSSGEPSKPGS